MGGRKRHWVSTIAITALLANQHVFQADAFVNVPSSLAFGGAHSQINKALHGAGSAEATSSASRYSGAGPAIVDMNQYNIPLEKISTEWVANLTPKSSMQEEGVFLGAKSDKELFVDTLNFEILRNGGMGIELLEIAGGREDGLGITIVSGLVEDGNAEGSGILEGDSIVNLSLRKHMSSTKGGKSVTFSEVDEVVSVSTECLGYDATIERILGLPEPENENENILITVKRLRRKPKVTVKLQYPPSLKEPDAVIELFSGENLRRAMLTRGIKLNDKLSLRFDSGGTGDCGADGTCATCVVGITKGMDLLNAANIQEKQILSKNPSWRMACKTVVGHGMKEGEMTVAVNPRQW